MLARQPHFMFTASDVESVMKETGLDKAQIQMWAEHLRHRFKIKKLDDTLDFLRSKKVTQPFYHLVYPEKFSQLWDFLEFS